jgi:hypothetical protein
MAWDLNIILKINNLNFIIMSRTNFISATLEPTLGATVLKQINDSADALPFLINLSKVQRAGLRRMGPKSVDYVNDTFVGASQFPKSLPVDFPLGEFEKDTILVKQLFPILIASQVLTEKLTDTMLALGTDCMKEADEVYDFLKIAAKTDTNAKALIERISKRFKGQGKKKKTIE